MPIEEDHYRMRWVGALILAAFPLYGGGRALLTPTYELFGFMLVLANSMAVIGIAILVWPIVCKSTRTIATIYAGTRLIEGLLLSLGALVAIVASDAALGAAWNDTLYRFAMMFLAIGSLWFCYWLLDDQCIPRWLASLGLFGYLALAVAMLASLSGWDTSSATLLVPGTVFEIVFGSILLIGKWRLNVSTVH